MADRHPSDGDHSKWVARDEIDDIVRRTVKETLLSMGLDTKNPLELQRDFQALRDWRLSMNAIRSRGMLTLIGIIVSGMAAALWFGVKHALTRTP